MRAAYIAVGAASPHSRLPVSYEWFFEVQGYDPARIVRRPPDAEFGWGLSPYDFVWSEVNAPERVNPAMYRSEEVVSVVMRRQSGSEMLLGHEITEDGTVILLPGPKYYESDALTREVFIRTGVLFYLHGNPSAVLVRNVLGYIMIRSLDEPWLSAHQRDGEPQDPRIDAALLAVQFESAVALKGEVTGQKQPQPQPSASSPPLPLAQ